MRIAIVGAGISGLGAAWLLKRQGHAVTLFEADARLGGHTATVDVTLDGKTFPVDTGFLVFNDRTYPKLIALFDELGVTSVASEMSFSCRIDRDRLEWAGTNLRSLFAQPANALRPAFWRMLADIVRFNRRAMQMHDGAGAWSITLGEFLDAEKYSAPFRDWYLLPMAAAIWSAPRRDILEFPLPTFVRFCAQPRAAADRRSSAMAHRARRLARLCGKDRGAIARRARRHARTPDRARRARRRHRQRTDVPASAFDAVVIACHSDRRSRCSPIRRRSEHRLLSAVRYQSNRVVLHTDAALLPRNRRAWSAWNYLAADDAGGQRPVAVSYLINRLQPLPCATPVIVTLNPPIEPDPSRVLREFAYSHPLLDGAAVAAQAGIAQLQGQRHTWYAGAWLGYGFHEDGLASAHAVADDIARRETVAARLTSQLPVAA